MQHTLFVYTLYMMHTSCKITNVILHLSITFLIVKEQKPKLKTSSDPKTRTEYPMGYSVITFSACDLRIPNLVEPVGIEPTTPCLQSRCSPS